jgi:hypothetical protein
MSHEDKTLTGADIFNRPAPKPERVHVPEWGGSVFIKRMTVKERDAYEQSLFDKKGRPNMEGARARLLIATAVTDAGLPIFGKYDEDKILSLDAAGVNRLTQRAMELAGMTEEDIEDAAEGFGTPLGDDDSSE